MLVPFLSWLDLIMKYYIEIKEMLFVMVCWLLYTVSELELDTVSSHTCTSKAGPTMTSSVPIQIIQDPAKVVFRIIRKT